MVTDLRKKLAIKNQQHLGTGWESGMTGRKKSKTTPWFPIWIIISDGSIYGDQEFRRRKRGSSSFSSPSTYHIPPLTKLFLILPWLKWYQLLTEGTGPEVNSGRDSNTLEYALEIICHQGNCFGC